MDACFYRLACNLLERQRRVGVMGTRLSLGLTLRLRYAVRTAGKCPV